jgi:hypothetical protein
MRRKHTYSSIHQPRSSWASNRPDQNSVGDNRPDDIRILKAFDLPLTEPRAATEEEKGGVEQLLTVDEVAARLSVSRNWVYNHADAIGGYRLGKYLRFSWHRVLEQLGR